MISGDNVHTAIDCARKSNILGQDEETKDKVLTGDEFRRLIGEVKRTIDKDGKERLSIEN